MSPVLAFIAGCFIGGGIVLYGLSILIHGQAPAYPPEVADRFEAQRQKASLN